MLPFCTTKNSRDALPPTLTQLPVLTLSESLIVKDDHTLLLSKATPCRLRLDPSRRRSQFNSLTEAPSGNVNSAASVIRPLTKLLTVFCVKLWAILYRLALLSFFTEVLSTNCLSLSFVVKILRDSFLSFSYG